MKKLLSSAFVIAVISVSAYGQSKSPPLIGVWRVTERTESPNAPINRSPQPGLFIFAQGYYSIMVVTGDKPRPALPQDVSKATVEELLSVWRPFTANAGTYEIKGDIVTTHPIVAKVMRPGGRATIKFETEGNTLTLTQVAEDDVPVSNPTSIKLTRVE